MAEASEMAVQAERPRRLFTVDEYHRMAKAGIFGPEEPQPDMLVLRPRAVSYSRAHPTPEDVLLAIEVADTTVRFDRIVKARLYARARIAEYWLIDTAHEAVDVFRDAQSDAYMDFATFGRGTSIAPLAFPDVAITVDDLFV
jgi:Uma2 family endonuclease